jgi:lipopolysaccharide export system permease protein
MRQLKRAMDSIKRDLGRINVHATHDALSYFPFVAFMDSNWSKTDPKAIRQAKKFDDLLPDTAKIVVRERAASLVSSAKSNIDVVVAEYNARDKDLRLHAIEWHRKISLSMACLVLFLIGAPLGSIIRKGGLGSPLIFAIIFFMLFYFLSNTGQKFAKEGAMSPFTGMWLATFILVPIGIFLIYKALRDSQLFNKEFYYRLKRDLQAFIQRRRSRREA